MSSDQTSQNSEKSTNTNKVFTVYFCLRISIFIILFIVTAAVYVYTTSNVCLEKKPKPVARSFVTKLVERIQPEDRDVFQDFRTSFLPPEHVNFPDGRVGRSKRDALANGTEDTVLLGIPQRVRTKRTDDEPWNDGLAPENDEMRDSAVDDNQLDETDGEYYEEYEDDEVAASASKESSPGKQEDRGPLDDVVEQVRAQPELEEEELGSAPRQLHLPRRYSGIHAFWKGQGDKETIRHTQANIMRQYMDVDADPCEDFFQYACGNWPTLNPIPADKAGYDTFEMLRENLDTVLKDLLEFKEGENYTTKYPGKHLDLFDNFLNRPKHIGAHDTSTLATHIRRIPAVTIHDNKINEEQIDTRYKRELLQGIRKYVKSKKKLRSKSKPSQQTNYIPQRKYTKKNILKGTFKENKKDFLQTQYVKKDDYDNDKIFFRRFGRQLKNYKNKDKTKDFNTENPIEPHKEEEDPAKGDATLKARFLFKSCMNYEILKKRGHQPLLDLLDLLGGWPILKLNWDSENFDWLDLMAKLRLYNNDILISEWVGPDIKNSDEFVIQFDQTSLGLPTRDYFLQESNKAYVQAYKEYLIKIVLLLGGERDIVEEKAEELIEFETRLAKITSAPEERRNVSELYRRMSLRQLESAVRGVHWSRYLSIVMNRTVDPDETVVLFAMKYAQNLVVLINETEPSTLSNYLLWRFVRHRVNNLDDRFQAAKQQFYNVLFGREQAPPRWKNCISQVNSNMGMALGSMFVRKYFDENSKNDTLTMTREIQKSFRELLSLTDWIDDETKRLAADKVDAMMLRIGYPDFILKKDDLDARYEEVRIHPDKYFENILNILQHLTKMEQARLGQPVNKTLWNTAPAVVNAYYSRNKNQIMFPAGILQPPFYHRHFPKSLNYGGIGVVIGHEITHGFDDKGRLFDCDGNLHRWWSDSAIETFHRRAQCLIDQYAKYVVPEVSMKLDGVNTQGENIADNGGVKQAFRAYKRWLDQSGAAAAAGETMPGLNHTHTQLFFLNFAQVWCGSMRPEAMRNKLKTAVHSPGRFRVTGALSNSEDFAREFSCRPGSRMNPVTKCSVW